MLNYSLNFDKNIEINTPEFLLNINYDSEEYFLEDEIIFVSSLSERLFENIENNFYQKAFKNFITNFFNQSWKHQYIILIIIISYSNYNDDIYLFHQLFDCFSELLISPENKVRFATLYCIKIFILKYKTQFFEKIDNNIFKMILNLLNNVNMNFYFV